MDLVAEEQRDIIFKEREEDLKRLSLPLNCTAFKTSIWDETLYKAWSNIVGFATIQKKHTFFSIKIDFLNYFWLGLHADSEC